MTRKRSTGEPKGSTKHGRFIPRNQYSSYKFTNLQEGEGDWSKIDAFVCAVGVDEEVVYSKSTALQVLLIRGSYPILFLKIKK